MISRSPSVGEEWLLNRRSKHTGQPSRMLPSLWYTEISPSWVRLRLPGIFAQGPGKLLDIKALLLKLDPVNVEDIGGLYFRPMRFSV
jgi:hypothetical protein